MRKRGSWREDALTVRERKREEAYTKANEKWPSGDENTAQVKR